MKVMIIDHESAEIQQFQELIMAEEQPLGLTIQRFKTPYEALVSILDELPNIVFLDVKTKKYDGLSIARQIKQQAPEIHIVYVTTDDRYAVDAFEVGAIDYLLPPFTKHRLQNTLQRIKAKRAIPQQHDAKFCCFGHLALQLPDGQVIKQFKWRTKKAQEVFAYLLMKHDTELRKDFLVDLFWAHLDWNQGMNALYTTIYQIRKTLEGLGIDILIDSRENVYSCRLNHVQYGPEQWEERVEKLEEVNEKNIIQCMHYIYLYKGDFLGIYHYSWAEIERLRLRSIWLQLISKATKYLLDKHQYEDVIKIYHYVQTICPEEQDTYVTLMKIYAQLENREAVIANYQALTTMLMTQYDEQPSEEIQCWYEEWQG